MSNLATSRPTRPRFPSAGSPEIAPPSFCDVLRRLGDAVRRALQVGSHRDTRSARTSTASWAPQGARRPLTASRLAGPASGVVAFRETRGGQRRRGHRRSDDPLLGGPHRQANQPGGSARDGDKRHRGLRVARGVGLPGTGSREWRGCWTPNRFPRVGRIGRAWLGSVDRILSQLAPRSIRTRFGKKKAPRLGRTLDEAPDDNPDDGSGFFMTIVSTRRAGAKEIPMLRSGSNSYRPDRCCFPHCPPARARSSELDARRVVEDRLFSAIELSIVVVAVSERPPGFEAAFLKLGEAIEGFLPYPRGWSPCEN